VKKGKFSFSNITILIKYIRNLEIGEQNKGCTQETNSLPELDNLERIFSLLFGNYKLFENFGNITKVTLLFCLLFRFRSI
jgi:hypothetical protein